jgi:Zn-dependent M28 family amino/carboxypeptidase
MNRSCGPDILPTRPQTNGMTSITMRNLRVLPACLFLSLLAAMSTTHARSQSVEPERLLSHIQTLASDDFEGRAPASAGEERTVAYLVDQFRSLGLQPGNPDGGYVQEVPLVGFQTRATGRIDVSGSATKRLELNSPEQWMAVSRRLVPESSAHDSPLVFVGFGVVAPEYGWDDYKGLDVRGKTLVMLVGDPPVPDPADPAKLDPKVFGGVAMTYYGRWTYKYEIAAEKGADAVLLIHQTGPAGYPFAVIQGSWGRENFEIPTTDQNAGRAAVEAWISEAFARELLAAAGQDLETLVRSASSRDFRPVELPARGTFHASNALREVRSKNVVARVPGTDPAVADETVVYTAHWDHLGRDPSLEGDQIYNGAADNASGTAALLEIARVLAAKPARRSFLFLAVTAEEKGLLGSTYYAAHPLYGLETTLADINMDVINLWGRTTDLSSVGLGQSDLDDLLVEVARTLQGRTVGPDAEPEKGLYYRSDHFEFARVGVPALNAKGGSSYRDRPADYGKQRRDEYTKNDYHKPSDEVKPDWDLTGAAEDMNLLAEVGRRVADGDRYPEWKPTSEFRARREAMRPKP